MALSKLEIFKESMKFSAAHFTIFSENERERLHGHNFQVYAAFSMDVGEEGLNIDYRALKKILHDLCSEWDEYVLLPLKSKYLKLSEKEDCVYASFNQEVIPFLRKDVLFLEVSNTTVEELSKLFAKKLQKILIEKNVSMAQIEVKISSGEGQWGAFTIEGTN